MKPHKHCDLIKAWADGAQIQIKRLYKNHINTYAESWSDDPEPTWYEYCDYRIKPREFEEGAFYPAINKYGQKCLIQCTSTECKPAFRDKHEFYSEPYYHWIGEPLNIDWTETE